MFLFHDLSFFCKKKKNKKTKNKKQKKKQKQKNKKKNKKKLVKPLGLLGAEKMAE